jgi:hypothetical protein
LIWDERENTNRFRQLLQLSSFPNEFPRNKFTNQDGTRTRPSSSGPNPPCRNSTDASYIAITNLIRAHRVWLILNADDAVPRPNATNEYDNDIFNAAFLFNPDGRLFAGIYHKQNSSSSANTSRSCAGCRS